MAQNEDKRLEILQNRINQYDIRFPVAVLVEKTGYDKGYISALLKGKKPISDNFWSIFDKSFPDKNAAAPPTPATTLLTGAHVTLQDHIDLLRDYNEKLFALLSSNLGKLYDGQQVMIAYQKAWVDYEAEKASAGDLQRKDEIKYKMSTLVDEQLHGDSSTYSQSGSGKRRKA